MSSSNCCFLTCIQISQEAGQVVWYSHLFQNFPQCIMIHTVKGFGIANKVEADLAWRDLILGVYKVTTEPGLAEVQAVFNAEGTAWLTVQLERAAGRQASCLQS